MHMLPTQMKTLTCIPIFGISIEICLWEQLKRHVPVIRYRNQIHYTYPALYAVLYYTLFAV